MNIKVEKGIDIPDRGKIKLRYPFAHMDVGDSFCVPAEKTNSLRVCANWYGKKWKMKFITRKVRTGTRIWRVK